VFNKFYDEQCCWCGEKDEQCVKLEENKYLCVICIAYGIDDFKIKQQENKNE